MKNQANLIFLWKKKKILLTVRCGCRIKTTDVLVPLRLGLHSTHS